MQHSIFITNLRFWLIAILECTFLGLAFYRPCLSQMVEPVVPVRNPGQMPLPPGLEIPHQKIKNMIGGVYSENITLFFRNSPYRVTSELIVEAGATMTIETGVQMYFDTGVGLKVWGTIRAIGNEFAHIEMLPYQQQLNYEDTFPDFKLIDGPTVRQGRLQVKFRDRWRGVCSALTNWTAVDTQVACKSMGYTDGAFYTWFRRNNDTYPFVMPVPGCRPADKNLWDCQGFAKLDKIPLSENLCQGEDDIGLYCWGQPTFTGWAKHWKGLQIFNSPFHYVPLDPDMVSVARESNSRLEFLDIKYAGYDGQTRNATPALYIEGVPPIMNGLNIHRSARDGIYFYQPSGPILIANSSVTYNRGHGIAIDNTTDGRVFINMTVVQGNFGDGIWYKQKQGGINLFKSLGNPGGGGGRNKRQSSYYEEEKPRIDMCLEHELSNNLFFPHLIKLHLRAGTPIDPILPPICWMIVSLPRRLPYDYTLQFLSIINQNPDRLGAKTHLLICDAEDGQINACAEKRFRIPIYDGVFPQSVSLRSSGNPIYVALEHDLGPISTGRVYGDIELQFKLHASATHQAFYGLNVTHSVVVNNTGHGIEAQMIRDRTALWNVTVESNEGIGFYVKDGAADIWVNDTSLSHNWLDGMNVSYAGGSININGSKFIENRWRGFAFHQNMSLPFLPLRQEIIIKGRPSNNIFYPPTIFKGNFWGGIVIGNNCLPEIDHFYEPKVLINWVQFLQNHNHPAIDIFACRDPQPAPMTLDITGNVFERNTEVTIRMQPAVNVLGVINSNQFSYNNYSALLIKNSHHPQLKNRYADISIAKNTFKFNKGPWIINIGLNEDAPNQRMIFNQQNEVTGNEVYNPFPFLKPRSTPYAALVVSSSNVVIDKNCFRNPQADYEIGTELMEHAKVIDARNNNWGYTKPDNFMHRIFDQFNRYSLASINVDPYAAVCNQRFPQLTPVQQYYRPFRTESKPYEIGGAIYENHDLTAGTYTVVDDLHIVPGAKLTVAPGARLEFMDGVGMLVQGELLRADYDESPLPVTFTARTFQMPRLDRIRLVDEDGEDEVVEGRLEILVEGQWGTVCNRSWTAELAHLACNQLGLTMDPQYFENWRIFVDKGDLPMIVDNIRCEENEFDITQCRHDGLFHNVGAGCRDTEVVGLRCARPYWAGVRYSLLANPPTVTGQLTMHNWLIERAGMYDYRKSTFAPALQIDWNYHSFNNITVRNNYFDGIDIIYNDLTKKPALRNIYVTENRRNGLKLRSVGITVEEVLIENNINAGVRFNPRISEAQQRDIVSWLDRREQPDLEANNVLIFPDNSVDKIQVFESQLNQRKFLVAKATQDCPRVLYEPCTYSLEISAVGHEYGLPAKIAVQIVNRANNESDEDAIFRDSQAGKHWSVKHNTVQFPIVSAGNKLTMKYTRSYGDPKLIVLILFLDAQEYLDRFIHVYESVIRHNQYGVSAVHYSNLTFQDGTVLNRHTNEKIWFQKVNFTDNSDAVVWIHSPQHEVLPDTPITEITWHIDNCSIHDNDGPIIDTHRDLFSSANVFHWNFWSNTFANNTNSGVFVHLPDSYNIITKNQHSFWMTENRFQNNQNFEIELNGFYCFANISSNNFTENYANPRRGIFSIYGMEKRLIMERNRFYENWGHWMVRMEINSQSVQFDAYNVPAYIQFNYFERNHFMKRLEEYVDSWPRSFAVGIFGAQKADIHFNRLNNALLDFEVIAGCRPQIPGTDFMNITHNWWGSNSDGAIPQRIFDMDDWNSYTIGKYSPYFTSRERFNDFWWNWDYAQLSHADYIEPAEHELHGRIYSNKNLTLDPERWYSFPQYYRPFRPYRITRDLTIMPGATLYIEKNVEVHVWPNVRILVLGNLIADATLWQPIRFLPLNVTEALEERGKIGTRYKRDILKRPRHRILNDDYKHIQYIRKKRRAGYDPVFRQFPVIRRDDPYFQTFTVSLTENSTISKRAGFLQLYNATTGEIVPSCDRQFTRRNAQVVCRELGLDTQNVYHWLTPRWDYNPRIRLVKTYMEPRECVGTETRLDKCNLRMTGNDSLWMCMDNEHFNYVHCGSNSSLTKEWVGNWGGITFGEASLEVQQGNSPDSSIIRHVEIVGGGQVHNDSFQSAALQIIRRNPIMENLNITNSSMHGLQIISPRDSIVLTRLNISDNKGQGMSVLTTNLKATNEQTKIPGGPMSLPYHAVGLLEMCAAGKAVEIHDRIIIYYKYDSRPVDCVKAFTSKTRYLGFRFLHANLYGVLNGVGRSDALSVYSDTSFSPAALLLQYNSESDFTKTQMPIRSQTLALHLRATAADEEYGFIAEISAIPTTPDSRQVEEVSLRNSRFINNDRGAMHYRNVGEVGPSVIIEQCSIDRNGYFLFGNVSTSSQAIEMHLHNTLLLLYRANSMTHNRGGLLVTADSSSAVAQLKAVIKNSVFAMNSNSTTLAFLGNNLQRVTFLNNMISLNFALYFDTVLIQSMSANFTRNLITNNTGLNTVDTHGYSKISSDAQTFEYNYFEHNRALGHQLQYAEAYGYQPDVVLDESQLRPRKKRTAMAAHRKNAIRQKRQVLNQKGVSFDWWTHVGQETERYRSTILAGSSKQKFWYNVFNNPLNPYELTTSLQTQSDNGVIDARDNYWGWPGTSGVAAGKIRDQMDFPYLIKVEYEPVLESNTSLIEGDCPAGWFQAGVEEFKSCFLFIGASMTYDNAVRFCEEIDAFMPILRNDDPRQKELAKRIDEFGRQYVTSAESQYSMGVYFDIPLWISSVTIPSNQCGFLSSRSGSIGEQNCNNLLPFVCEKGTKPYQEPVLWRRDIIIAVILVLLLILILALLFIGWCAKSSRRKEEVFTKKQYIRESLRRQKDRSFRNQHSVNGSTIFVNEQAKNAKDNNKFKPIQAHSPMVAATTKGTKKGGKGSRSSESTSTTTTGDQTYSTPTDTTRTTCTDSFCTDNYTETTYTVGKALPPRNIVSTTPNPYSEITTLRQTNRNIKLGPRRDTDLSTSSCTTCSGIYSLQTCTCSNCPTDSFHTERESTITEESSNWDNSSSSRSSQLSDTTITERPLLGRQVISGIDRAQTKSSMTTLRASSRPDLTQRSYADYFRGSGRPPPLTPSRSNPSLYHQPPPPSTVPIPVPFPRVPSETPMVETYDREPGVLRPRKQSWHSTVDHMTPTTPFQRGSIPVYNPNPELKQAFSHSPTSSRTHLSSSPGRPKIPPPRRPDPNSRSLVDLYSQNQQQQQKHGIYEAGSALETSM